MRTATTLLVLLVLLIAAPTVTYTLAQEAQEITADFAKWLPDMSADDARISAREVAQQGWQRHCMAAGAPGQESLRAVVNKLMVEQLSQDIPVVTKVWLLHELEWTGTTAEVAPITQLIDDTSIEVRDAAMRALATIRAAGAKQTYHLISSETVMPLALPYAGEDAVKSWMAGYAGLSSDDQARTLAALAARRDTTYNTTVISALDSPHETVKKTALFALGALATPNDISTILSKGMAIDRGVAIRVLATNMSPRFETALQTTMEQATSPTNVVLLAEVLCSRYCRDALKPILAWAKRPEFADRLALLVQAEKIATKEQIGDMIDATLLLTDRRQRDTAEQIVVRLCSGDIKPVTAKMQGLAEMELLPLLGRMGGIDALAVVSAARGAASAEVRSAAVRALCNWPNAVVADDLLQLTEDEKESPANRLAALRAYIRVISLPADQIGIDITSEQKLVALKKGMTLATRNDERQLVLERVGAVRLTAAAAFAMEFFDTPELTERVCRTVADIAHDDQYRKANKAFFQPILDKLRESTQDQGIKDRLSRYLRNM